MVVPRPFFDPTAAAAAGRFSLSEPLSHGLQSWPETFASSAGGPGPVSPAAKPMRASILPQHEAGPPKVRLMPFNAQHPNSSPEPFRPVSGASEVAPNSGQTNPSPVASTGGRSGQSGTLLGATGGTQTHSRRTGSKLGQLPCARQGLVRVPESNTKYGGKAGKEGVALRRLCRQVSVSPQGFPSEKNCLHRAGFGFVPLFTGQLFIVPEGLLWRDSGRGYEGPGCHARRAMASGPKNRQGAP